MRRFTLLMSLILFVSCASEKALMDSPLTPPEIQKLQNAKTIEDIFDTESEIQLATNAECAIALITDIKIDTEGNFLAGELPFSFKIIGTHGNCLLIRHWEESKKPEDQPNPKIIWLKLKI